MVAARPGHHHLRTVLRAVIDRLSTLTDRERDVLKCLELGMGTTQISQELFITPTTTRNHIQTILIKLDARTRLQAVAIARGLTLTPPTPEPVPLDRRAVTVLEFLLERGIEITDAQVVAIVQVFL